MPQVIIIELATEGLERCRLFLARKAPAAATRAGQAIEQQLLLLETTPDIGRPFDDLPELRELLIPFGDSGYVALYRHDPPSDTLYVLAFRHQKKDGRVPSRPAPSQASTLPGL